MLSSNSAVNKHQTYDLFSKMVSNFNITHTTVSNQSSDSAVQPKQGNNIWLCNECIQQLWTYCSQLQLHIAVHGKLKR